MLQFLSTLYTRRLWRGFEASLRHPAQAQHDFLMRVVRENADTSFGREHGFASIRSVADYRKQVPIRTFSELSPWVDRVAAGAKGELTSEPVTFFNQSSGTSGKPKLIPVTESWVKETGRLRLIWGGLTRQAHPRLISGKAISIVYAAYGGKTSGNIEYGSLSGRVYLQSPWLLRRRYALPYAIARIRDPESKQYASMRLAAVQDVTFLFSTNAATVLAMVETGERRAEEIIRDLRDGTLNPNLDLPEGVREALAPLLAPNPTGAQKLETMLKTKGRLRPMDYWPNCVLLGCWLGSTVGVAARRLPEWFSPGLKVRDVGLAASEGVYTLPVEDGVPYGPLTVSSNFLEFIPAREADQASPPALGAAELEVGQEYVIIPTTSAGLYRYNINDVVRVVGKLHGTPMVEFVRKGNDSANLAGEKMDVSHLLEAVDAAQKATGIEILHFRVQADLQKMQYRFHVELPGGSTKGTEQLAAALQQKLAAANSYYAKWVGEKQLLPLEVVPMRQGWFDRYVNHALSNGGRHGQFKPALLTSNPEPENERATFGN
jgi:hypothetical protein